MPPRNDGDALLPPLECAGYGGKQVKDGLANQALAIPWFLAGLYSVIAVHGGGGMSMAVAAMFSGFMFANCLANRRRSRETSAGPGVSA